MHNGEEAGVGFDQHASREVASVPGPCSAISVVGLVVVARSFDRPSIRVGEQFLDGVGWGGIGWAAMGPRDGGNSRE